MLVFFFLAHTNTRSLMLLVGNKKAEEVEKEMDVIFETQKGGTFTMEIGYFDTILEIKEKIQKYKEIPVANQTLTFKNKVLRDENNVFETGEILDNSRIHLFISSDSEKPNKITSTEENSPLHFTRTTYQLLLKLPTSKSPVSVEVDSTDRVDQLKEKIREIEGLPTNRLVLHVNGGVELQDHRNLHEYELTDGSEIEVAIKPLPTASVVAPKKLKVVVLPKCGTKKIMVEVNPSDKVQVLRSELEKLQERFNFQLPIEGYFFIYKQNVMEEMETFQWHNFRQGDIIEIFNGSVTGGS